MKSITANPKHSRLIIASVGLSASTYYYRPQTRATMTEARGRKPTIHTLTSDGAMAENSAVLDAVERILRGEFVCYGHRAMAAQLRREGFVINHKKLYRLMSNASLLRSERAIRLQKRLLAKRGRVEAVRPHQHLQMDIKYVYIYGEKRWAYLLTVIDVFTRCVLAQLFARSVRANEVITLLQQTAPEWTARCERIRLRTDHGSQFIANELAEALESLKIDHEFTHPGVPEENAFIESWHSIFQTEVASRCEFASFDDAEQTIKRHRQWYQHERLHGSLKYQTPEEFAHVYRQNKPPETLP